MKVNKTEEETIAIKFIAGAWTLMNATSATKQIPLKPAEDRQDNKGTAMLCGLCNADSYLNTHKYVKRKRQVDKQRQQKCSFKYNQCFIVNIRWNENKT